MTNCAEPCRYRSHYGIRVQESRWACLTGLWCSLSSTCCNSCMFRHSACHAWLPGTFRACLCACGCDCGTSTHTNTLKEPLTGSPADACKPCSAFNHRPNRPLHSQTVKGSHFPLCRITAVDDARGVGEPLQETLCGSLPASSCPAGGLPARGQLKLVLGPMAAPATPSNLDADSPRARSATAAAKAVPRLLRRAQQQLNDPLLLAFGQLPAGSAAARSAVAGSIAAAGLRGRWSGLSTTAAAAADMQPSQTATSAAASSAGQVPAHDPGLLTGVSGLPAAVHLLTLMRAEEEDPSNLIVRLAHSFQVCASWLLWIEHKTCVALSPA